jgi:glycosyltransferase involved in cell wall biosynthesis
MKVLFLTSSYPTAERPIDAIFVKEHARAAAQHAEVAVVHLDRTDDAPLLPSPTRTADADFPTWHVPYRRKPEPLSYAANLVAAFRAYARVRRAGFDPDVIHANFFIAGIPAVVLGRLFRKPVVLTEHWTVFLSDDPAALGKAMTRAARFAFEGADVVLPVSRSLAEGIVATTGARTRFRVVPNVVDEGLFSLPAGGRTNGTVKVLGVGDLFEQKGWDVLIDAVAELRRRGRRAFTVEIVGAGPLEDAHRRQAAELGLDGVVTFLGYRSKSDVAEIMRSADLFVLPSRFENSPCVIGEALSTGVPVVATAVGGVPELIRNGEGLLALPQDAENLADQLEQGLEQLSGFDRPAISAAAHARFGIAAVGRTLAEVYEEVTEGR